MSGLEPLGRSSARRAGRPATALATSRGCTQRFRAILPAVNDPAFSSPYERKTGYTFFHGTSAPARCVSAPRPSSTDVMSTRPLGATFDCINPATGALLALGRGLVI